MARKAIYKHATQVNTTTYPDDGSSPVGTNEWNEAPDAEGMFGNTPQTTTVSIATGDLMVTDSVTVAAAETGTTDTLDKLLITNTNEYDLIYLFGKTGQTITLTNTSSPSVSGQVKTISDADEVLSTTKPTILIRKGNYWYGYGGGAGGAANSTQTYARNSSGSTITKGSPVYISGFDVGTTNPEISLADASVSGTMPCIGLVSADIANNATGTVIASGQLTTLNTSTYSVGDTLYVSETTGTLTATKPTGTALIQNIAIVERVHSSFGVVHISAINRSNDLPNIPDGKLWIGNSSAVPTDVTLSGDVTVTNSGVTAIGATKVTNAMLAGSIANTKLTTDPLDYANMTAPVASVAFNSQKLTGLADGAASTDAATKGQLDTAVASNITLKGGYNASTNTPNLDSTPTTVSAGDHYVVTTAGTFYSESLQEGDSLIASSANPTTFAGWIITNNNVVTPITNAQVAASAAIDQSKIASLTSDLALKAALASPTFTGTVTADNLTATGTLTATLTGTATNVTGTVAISTGGTGATTRQAGIDALTDSSNGTTGHVLTRDSNGNAVFAAAAGGSTLAYTPFANTQTTTYTGNQTTFTTVGVGERDIYIKKIDANNEGVFTKIWKNGAAVEVQIA